MIAVFVYKIQEGLSSWQGNGWRFDSYIFVKSKKGCHSGREMDDVFYIYYEKSKVCLPCRGLMF